MVPWIAGFWGISINEINVSQPLFVCNLTKYKPDSSLSKIAVSAGYPFGLLIAVMGVLEILFL